MIEFSIFEKSSCEIQTSSRDDNRNEHNKLIYLCRFFYLFIIKIQLFVLFPYG